MSRLDWLNEAIAALETDGLRRYLTVRESPQTRRCEIGGRSLVNFSSNDYLGLAADPRLVGAWQTLARTSSSGWGSGASPLVTGRSGWHAALEAELAAFEDAPSALLFGTGYAANVGAITALVGHEDVILSDAKNHASIVDGCRLARATTRVYAHNDLIDLQRLLQNSTSFRRRLIVSDTLFSMDGDVADVAGLAELAHQYDCMLMVDEAHATGVFGEHGRGVCEAQGVEDGVDIRVGTLSKAFGSHGGFVVGPKVLTEWLANRARPYVFSTAAPDAVAAVSCEALRIVRDEPDRRRGLLERAVHLREQLTRSRWHTGRSTSQIIPLMVGDARRAVALSHSLRERGFLVPAIRPPSVPAGEALLRISVTYLHDPDTLNQLVAACS